MATGAAIPILYKGAGPGTHWHINDPRLGGFITGAMPATPNAVVRHITNYSFPSAYLSFSTSFAIARSYALTGPGGLATTTSPGFVYEIDLSAITAAPALVDPVHSVSSNGMFAHNHNGAGALIAEVSQERSICSMFNWARLTSGVGSLLPKHGFQTTVLSCSSRRAHVAARCKTRGLTCRRGCSLILSLETEHRKTSHGWFQA